VVQVKNLRHKIMCGAGLPLRVRILRGDWGRQDGIISIFHFPFSIFPNPTGTGRQAMENGK
jgi:hypothetical protein